MSKCSLGTDAHEHATVGAYVFECDFHPRLYAALTCWNNYVNAMFFAAQRPLIAS